MGKTTKNILPAIILRYTTTFPCLRIELDNVMKSSLNNFKKTKIAKIATELIFQDLVESSSN